MSDTAAAVNDLLNAPPPAAEATPPAPAPDAQAAPPTSVGTDTPFLKVDDRTSYKNQEDAVKGWNELNRTASEGRKFKDIAETWGVKDPAVIEQLFQELLDLRAKQQQAPATATPSTGDNRSDKATVDKAAAGDKLAYESLSPEWKQHVDYLNRMGYVREDRLQPLEARIAQFEKRDAAAQDAHVQAAKDAGVSILATLIERDKLPNDEISVARIAKAIESEIVDNSRDAKGNLIPNSVEDRYLRGNPAERQQIIEDQYKWFLEFGDKYATAKNASYVAAKTTAQASQPRTMPPGSGPASTERSGKMTDDQRKAALGELFTAGGMSK